MSSDWIIVDGRTGKRATGATYSSEAAAWHYVTQGSDRQDEGGLPDDITRELLENLTVVSDMSTEGEPMRWRYRVMRDSRHDPPVLEIVEAYTEDGDDHPTSWGAASVSTDNGMDDLRWTLEHMLKALDEPVWDRPDV